jgi:hypothetical protein
VVAEPHSRHRRADCGNADPRVAHDREHAVCEFFGHILAREWTDEPAMGYFHAPEKRIVASFGRLLLGLFEVGLGVLLIILDAASTSEQTASGRLGVYRRDSAHPPGLPDAQSTQGKTCGLTENREQFNYQAKRL